MKQDSEIQTRLNNRQLRWMVGRDGKKAKEMKQKSGKQTTGLNTRYSPVT